MKKIFFGLTFLIILIIVGAYGVLFTKKGNDFVANFLEDKVNSEDKDIKLKINDFTLTFDTLNIDISLDNNSKVKVNGDFFILDKKLDLKYDIKIEDLSKLQKFTKQKLNGSFSTSGTFKGTQELSILDGSSDLAKSSTVYNVEFVDFKPKDVQFLIENAKVQTLLYMLNQPIYANGNLSIDGKISNTDIKNLDGLIVTSIKNTKVNNSVANKAFNLKLISPVDINTTIKTKLVKNEAISQMDFLSTFANLYIKKAIVNLETLVVTSDYSVKVTDLSKLFDLTATKMRGNIDIDGTVLVKDKVLAVDGKSNLLGGSLDYKLMNNDLLVNTKKLEVKKITHMLYYPEVFDSSANLALNYNLLRKKGKLIGTLEEGNLLANNFSSLLNKLSRYDITREVYETVDINSDINNLTISSVIAMKSKNTNIDITSSKLDLEKSDVDARITVKIKKLSAKLKVSGKINKPDISFDGKNLLKEKAKELVDKNKEKVKNKLKDVIKDKLGDNKEEMIKNIKSFF